MKHAEPTEAVTRAAAAVGEALTASTQAGVAALETCFSRLDQARRILEAVASGPAFPSGTANDSARRALLETRTSLLRLRARMALADDFYSGWVRLRAILSGGYAPGGDPAATPVPGRVLAEG